MKKIIDTVLAYRVLSAVLAVALIGVVYVGFFRSSGETEATFTIESKPFTQQVSVSGKVVAAREVDLGFSQSGRVTRVYVDEGQRVSQGAIIAEVDNGDLYALVAAREAARDREVAKLDALKRGTRPEELALTEAALSAAVTSKASAEQALLDAVRDAYAKSDAAIHSVVDQQFSNPNSIAPQFNVVIANSNQKTEVENQRLVIEPMLRAWSQDVSASSVGSSLDSIAQQSTTRLQQIAVFLGTVSSALESSQTSPALTQTQIDAYKAAVSAQRTAVAAAQSALTGAQKGLSAAESARITAERDLTLKRAGASTEDVRAQEAAVKAAVADVNSAYASLGKSQIRAPFAGTISKLEAKVGKIVSPNTSEVTLIGAGAFEIESYVPEINVGFLAVDDAAIVTLDAITDETFDAKVTSIDISESVRDGVSTYRTMLTFTNPDPRIRSGMTANVEIITEEKESVVSIPVGFVQYSNGKKLVTVKVGKKSESREVTTGAISSVGEVEILSGLKPGDVVVEQQ